MIRATPGPPAHSLPRPLLLAGALAACNGEPLYVRVQTEDAPGMKAPVEHVVRITVNPDARTVSWEQDSRDARGVASRKVVTYGGRMGSDCELTSQVNWTCIVYDANGEVLERAEMREGHLTRFYWMEPDGVREVYQRQVRVLGVTF